MTLTSDPPVSPQIKARGRPFEKGKPSANPRGRPKGARNKLTILCEAMMEDDAPAITKKVIAAAKRGSLVAARLVLDRVVPVRGARLKIKLPEIEGAADIPRAIGAIVQAVANGELTAEEAAQLGSLIDAQRKAIELFEIEQRIVRLEAVDAARH